MDISILIVTFNRKGSLKDLLNSLLVLDVPHGLSWEMLIVDNDSTDGSKEMIFEYTAKTNLPIRYIFEPVRSKSAALNKGMAESKGDIIVFLDDDMTADPGYLKAVTSAAKRYADVNIFGGRIIIKWLLEKPDWIITEGPYRNIDSILGVVDGGEEDKSFSKMTTLPSIGNAFVRRKAVLDNPFRRDLGPRDGNMGYGEDTEFFKRLQGKGEDIFYIKDALTFHNVETYKFVKKYFLKRQFNIGRHEARFIKPPPGTVFYFGKPRYLFRLAATLLLKYLLNIDRNKRFFYKLKLYYLLGFILDYNGGNPKKDK